MSDTPTRRRVEPMLRAQTHRQRETTKALACLLLDDTLREDPRVDAAAERRKARGARRAARHAKALGVAKLPKVRRRKPTTAPARG